MKSSKGWEWMLSDPTSESTYKCEQPECRNVRLPEMCHHVEKRLGLPSMREGVLVSSHSGGKRVRQEDAILEEDMDKFSAPMIAEPPTPDDLLETLEKYPLSNAQKTVLVWRLTTQLTYRELSKQLNMPWSTIRSLYKEAEAIIRSTEGVSND
jgi:hypothetical protein